MIDVDTRGRVRRVGLNRPEKRNALNLATCSALVDAFDQAESDPAIGAILLYGHGTAFCAGMDLQEVLSADREELANVHERLFTTIYRARKPIVAAIQGAALAAGTGLAANAHFVVAAPDARFGLTEIRIGLWPMMVFRSVALAIGGRRTTELSLTGRTFSADEAFRFGLVTEIDSDPLTRGFERAAKLSGLSPDATVSGLDYVNRTRELDWREAAPVARQMRTDLMATGDFEEGVRAFLEKREPAWPSLQRTPGSNG